MGYKFSFDINKMFNLSNNSGGTVLILLGANPTSTTELCLYQINNERKILLWIHHG